MPRLAPLLLGVSFVVSIMTILLLAGERYARNAQTQMASILVEPETVPMVQRTPAPKALRISLGPVPEYEPLPEDWEVTAETYDRFAGHIDFQKLYDYFDHDTITLLLKEFDENSKISSELDHHPGAYSHLVRILFAIIRSENGSAGRQLGVLPNGKNIKAHQVDTLEKQAGWSAMTICKNWDRWSRMSVGEQALYQDDFLRYFADVYAPIKAKNDPNNLNVNWYPNVSEIQGYW